jgi:hypothetical protein
MRTREEIEKGIANKVDHEYAKLEVLLDIRDSLTQTEEKEIDWNKVADENFKKHQEEKQTLDVEALLEEYVDLCRKREENAMNMLTGGTCLYANVNERMQDIIKTIEEALKQA